ncbi:ureidoglycolate hydrolase [Nemania sp. FL0031]|nr:ureidoglycolate hydrolase [Nemania sp. FL0031]
MLVRTIPLTEPLAISAAPLTREAFAPFGDVVANPRPDATPSNTAPEAIARGELPCGAISANQGTAIQYKGIASMRDLYGTAPSGKTASPRMTMFVCGARTLVSGEGGRREGEGEAAADSVEIKVLERHPFTSQTFIPLTADETKRYLVVVAPTLEATSGEESLPVPTSASASSDGMKLPGAGLPDVRKLTAFVATGAQAVTYAAGTWHAPMIALVPRDSTIDFVVVQFADDVPVEDCQEVALEGAARIWVRVTEMAREKALAKL